MILIGSFAIKYWFPDFPRDPKDKDFAVDKVMSSNRETEYLYNPVICNWVKDDICCSPDELYTLKVSHLFWDINWEKHMWDVQWLKEKGCKLILPLFYELYEFWNKYHGKNKRSRLDMSSEQFFDNAITCPYSHDWLHILLNNPPTYTKVLKDGAEVNVSEEKFNLLSKSK